MEDYRAAIENLSLDQLTKNLKTLRESGVWKSLKPSERNALRKEYKAAFDFLSRRDEAKAKIEGLSAIEQEDAENARMAQELRKEGGILGNLTRDFARGVATTPASAARVAGFALDRLGAKETGLNLTGYAQNVEDTANVLYPPPLPDAGMVEKIGSAAAENLVPMLATGFGTKSALKGIGRLTQAPRALKAAEIVGAGVGMSAPEILRESTTFDEYGNPQLPKNATPIIAGALTHGAIETGLGLSPVSLVTKGKGKFLTGLFAKDTIKRIATLNKRYGPAKTAAIVASRIFKDTPLGGAIEEGFEEVLQSPVTILTKNLANADVKEALSKSFDEMANLGYLEGLGEEFAIGTAVGGIYGGARTTIDKIDNAIESKKTPLKEKQELAKQKEQLLLESDRTRRQGPPPDVIYSPVSEDYKEQRPGLLEAIDRRLIEYDRTRRQDSPPDVIYSPVSEDYKEQRPGLLEAIDRRLIEYDRTRRQDSPPDVIYAESPEWQGRKLIGTGEIPRAIETYRTQARSVPPGVINVPPTSDSRPMLELLNEMNNAKKIGDTEAVNRIIDLVNARQSQTSMPRKMERPAPQEVSQLKAIKEVEKKPEPQKKPRALIGSEDKKEPAVALKTNTEIKTNKRSGKALAHSPSGRSLNVRYDAISADDLITSDMPEFPKELQPRDRTTLFSADQISKIAASPIINKLITDYPDADTGSPIVVPYKGKYVVISGNGRTMGMRQGYEFGTMKEYKERLNNEGREYGIQNITENKPIFVRVLEGEHSQEELKKLAIDLNRESKLAMSAGETANVDAGAVRKYAHLVTNFSDITSTNNWEFLQSFFGATTIKSDLSKFISRAKGLTNDGVAKLERALFAGAYGDGRIATMFAEDPDPNVANIINGMLNAAPAVAHIDTLIEQNNAYDLSISRTVAETVDELSRLRLEGKSIEHYFLQPSLPGVQQRLSKTGEDLLRIFDKFKRSGKKITDFLVGYCDVVKKLGSPMQPTFEEVVIPTRAEIMQAVIERMLGSEQPNLFSGEAGSRISFKENDGLGGQSRQAVEQSAKTKPIAIKEAKVETPVKEEASETNVEGTSSLQEASEKKAAEPKKEIKQKDKKPEEKPKDKIEDFGEVLEGAKKHYAAEYASSLGGDSDASDVPLTKFWPVPNYEKLIQSGISKDTVSLVRAIRETLPKKPKSMYRSTLDWSYYIKLLRGEAARLLSGEITVDDFKGTYKKLPTAVLGLYDLYNAIGHESSLSDFSLRAFNKKGGLVYGIIKGSTILSEGETKEEAIEAFKQKLPDYLSRKGEKGRISKFSVYVRTSGPDKGKAFVGAKVGTSLVELKQFDNVKEAREYLKDNTDELIEILSKHKELPDVREKVNRERQGKDRRGGKDITPEDFSKAFGFRGVQFGNWVESGRRQEDLNNAYDALLDLAEIISVPTRALSLNGSLGLAFGARGSGGKDSASAHYEPAKVVINLTKKKGAGSLAHEWFHALDNYFGKKPERNASEGRFGPDEREEAKRAFTDLMNTIMRTELPERSSEMDKRRSNKYWSTRIEMIARAFESYVINKLENQAYSNDYLANIKREYQFDAIGSANMYPYLKKSEIAAVVDAFDNLFNTLKTEETEKGIRLYSAEYLVAKYAAQGLKQAAKVVRRGAALIHSGVKEFAKWARQLVSEFGQNVKKYLVGLYKDVTMAYNRQKLHNRRGALGVRFKTIEPSLPSQDIKQQAIEAIKNVGNYDNPKNIRYHGGEPIDKIIDEYSHFGTGIFFSSSPYSLGGSASYVINIDDYKTVTRYELTKNYLTNDEDIIEQFSKRWGIDYDTAFNIILEYKFEEDLIPKKYDYADVGWNAQKAALDLAKKYGFDGFEGRDEQGTYWLMDATKIDMVRMDLNENDEYEVLLKGKKVSVGEVELESIGVEAPLYSVEYLVAKYTTQGLKQAKKVIQRGFEIMSQGVRDLASWAKQMLREFGQNIKDYVRGLYKDLGTAFKERALHSRRGAISYKDIKRETKRLLKSKDFKWEKIDKDTYLLQFTSPDDGEMSTVAKLARNKTGKGSHRWIWVGSKYVFLDANIAKATVKSKVFEKMKRLKVERDKVEKVAKMVEKKEREEIEKAKAYMAEGDNRTAEVKLPKTYKDRIKHLVNRAEEVLFDIWAPVRRLQEEAKNKIGEIPDSLNLYRKLELVSGKIEEHVKSAKKKYLEDVKGILIKNGIEVKKFNRFLYVSHAEERNEAINKLEGSPFKRLGRPGSGISTEQARKELEEFEALPNYAAYKEAAEITYKLNNFLLDEQVRLGLLAQKQRDYYRRYKKYTPLKSPPDQGLILDRRALGRRSQASEQLAFIEQSIYAVYNRGFKKDISSTAIKFFNAFPNKALYERVKPKKVQYIDKKGKVTVRQEMEKFFGSPEMLWAKDPATGDYVVYKIKDKSLREALVNNFKEDTIETNFFRFFKKVNNWLAATATAWNPEFIYTNLIRDVQQGAAGVGVMLPEGSTVKFLSNLKRARQAIADDKAGNNTEDAVLLKEYKLAGGKTGYSEFSRLEERASNLEKEVSQAIKGGKLHSVKQSLKKALDFISEWNDAIETRTRFAGYLTAKEAGFSTQKAAAFAKNMTVNFNKKGSWAPILNSLYLFSSANLGGNLVTAKVLAKASKTKKGKAMIAGAVTLGFVSEIINSLIAGDDDEDGVNYYDKVADYIKDSNFVFMIPGGKGKYVAIPMPYGLNVLPSIGRNMAASMFGQQTAKDGAANIIGNLLDAFNPLGGDRRSLPYHVVPTAARPFVDVATNTTWTGRKIRPEQEVFGSDVARAELYYADNSKVIVEISKFLNEISGGDRYKSGFLDFLTPGEIEHLLAQSTGGVGKTITRAADLVTKSEKELTLNTLPIMRRFINSSNDYQSYEAFRTNAEMIKDFDRAKREKDVEWLKDKRWLVPATEKFKRIQKITTQVNKSKLSELQKRERLLKEIKGFNKYFDKLKSKVLSRY